MKRRHALVLLAAAATMVVPVAANAAGSAQVTSPAADQQVAGTVALEATVDGDNRDMFGNGPDHQVTMRLTDRAGGGAAAGTRAVTLQCLDGPCNADSTWGGTTFDPVSFAPFGRPDRVCNGAWYLQVDVDGAGFGPTHRILISQLPGAPSGLAVTGGVRQATVQWAANSEPDIAGYRIQRRAASTAVWSSVAEVDAGTTSFTDSPAAGQWEYRVLALRPDGRGTDGAPTTACDDSGRELSAASSPRTVTVTAPAPSPSPTPSPSASPSTGGGGGTNGGGGSGPSTGGGSGGGDGTTPDGDGTTPGGDGTTPTTAPSESGGDGTTPDADDGTTPSQPAGDGTTPDAGDGTTPRPSAGGRVAPPSRGSSSTLSLGTGVVGVGDDGTAPRVAAPNRQRERYYGEDGEFTEELDFGDAQAVGGSETRERTVLAEQTVRVPGALQVLLGEELAVGRIATSVAGGLLLLALALHLRRWTAEGVRDV